MRFRGIPSVGFFLCYILCSSISAFAQDDDSSLSANPERLIFEPIIGGISGTLGGLLGGIIGSELCSSPDGDSTCILSAIGGAYVGVLASFPVGVYVGGIAGKGRGNFWATVAVPWAFDLGFIALATADFDVVVSPEALIVGGALSLVASIVLYEITSSVASNDKKQTATVGAGLFGDHTSVGLAVFGKL